MVALINSRFSRTISLLITIFSLSLPAYAKYSGGTGEPNDPYQIATAADLITLGETSEDYEKHFILTADIDLDPNLPGGRVFDRAVIAPDTNDLDYEFQGITFTGVFNGNSHIISHLVIRGGSYLGLFGQLAAGADVRALGVIAVNVGGADNYVGALAARNVRGMVTHCFSTGLVSGIWNVGGLMGCNNFGAVTQCCSTCSVSGTGWAIGGLVGSNIGLWLGKIL